MTKDWYFDRFCGAQIAVCAENGKIVEVELEREGGGDVTGNVYKGRVANVVGGIQAAFVACGMEKNCYLPLNEHNARLNSYDGEADASPRAIEEGEELLVQIVKPAYGSKGAKVTADLAFVGRLLIYLPQTKFLGISRKITDTEQREKLLSEADKLRSAGEGFIVRTAAEHAAKKSLKTEAEYLRKLYRSALEYAASAPVGTLVYREYDLPMKVMRDSLGEIGKIYVGDRTVYERFLRLAKIGGYLPEKKFVLYTGKRAMLEHYGLAQQINALAGTRVPLGNGGDIVINRTEAMTVVDVNTGKFTGEDDLESTSYETNLQAAREVARQVRLRNIGGIVAVDFIDMLQSEHRAAVQQELENALFDDRAKTRVYEMSELCVALFTRKRTKNDLLSIMLKPCPYCAGDGHIPSDLFLAVSLRGKIMDCFADGYGSVIIDVNAALMKRLLAGRYFTEDAKGAWLGKRVYFVPREDLREEKFAVRGDDGAVLTVPDNAQILY
ncbi:MAG: Rne/Rng family ribonuclease [Clostridia bacterium]|jgi:ribonuclease G|nr:Rne/Rng family ribonuclease [Clostridia bacterium]